MDVTAVFCQGIACHKLLFWLAISDRLLRAEADKRLKR